MSLCAIILPSRARPDGLIRCLQSIRDTASDFEVLIKLDMCDPTSLQRKHEFEAYPNTRVFIGPRLKGYGSLTFFEDLLCNFTTASWSWILNDDAWLEGAGWDKQLATVPTSGFIVQPEAVRLGGSTYTKCDNTAFPIVPNMVWRTNFGMPLPDPSDSGLDNLLRVQSGWQTQFLTGLKVHHDRDEAGLHEHRRL